MKIEHSFPNVSVTTETLRTIAEVDLTYFKNAYRVRSMTIHISLPPTSRFDPLKIVLQSPSGVTYVLVENRCYGCNSGALSLEFTNAATMPLPVQNCTSGEYLPLVGAWTLDSLNTPSSFGVWSVLSSTGSNTTFHMLDVRFEFLVAQVSISVGLTLCSDMQWISDTATIIQIPVGSGKNRLVGIVVASQVGETVVPAGYHNYSSPEIVSAAESQHSAGVPCTANVQVNVMGSNFVVLPPPMKIALGMTVCRATMWVSDSYALCKSPARSKVSLELGVKLTVDSVLSNDVKLPVQFATVQKISNSNFFPSSGSLIASIHGSNFGCVSNSASFRSYETSVLLERWLSDSALWLKSPDSPKGLKTIQISLGSYTHANTSNAWVTEFFSSNSSMTSMLRDARYQNVFREVPAYPTTGSTCLHVSGANLVAHADISVSLRLAETSSQTTLWYSFSHIVAKAPSGVQQFDRLDVAVSVSQLSHLATSMWSYDSPVFGNSVFLNVSLDYELIQINGSNFGSVDMSPIAHTVANDHPYSLIWTSDSSVSVILDTAMPLQPYNAFVIKGGQNNTMKAFAMYPNSRFYVPPINVSESILAGFTNKEEMNPLTQTNLTSMSIQIGSYQRLYLNVYLNSSFPATIRNLQKHVTEFVPVLFSNCKLTFISSHSNFEDLCSGLPKADSPCMLPPEKMFHSLFGTIYVSPCKMTSSFQIKFSADAVECLDAACTVRRQIAAPIVAISPLITVSESSFKGLKRASVFDENSTVFADRLQHQQIAFEVFGTDLNCAATRVAGWLRLEPVQSNGSFPLHTQNSSALLNSIHDLWLPWSVLEVSVYFSCNFTLSSWSVAKVGSYQFVFTLSSGSLNATSEIFKVYPGFPSVIMLIGVIKQVMSGGDLVFSLNSTDRPPAIYLSVVDINNNTVVSPINPHYTVHLTANDSIGRQYYFGGNVSNFSCSLDENGSCRIQSVRTGLKTRPDGHVILTFTCESARLVIGPIKVEKVGIPAKTAFALPPNISSVVIAGQSLPSISMYITDDGGNIFQIADIQNTTSAKVAVRIVVKRIAAMSSSRRVLSAATSEETQDTCPGGGSYVIPLVASADGVAVVNIGKTVPCTAGSFVITYELGFSDDSNNFIRSGISQYESMIVVEPGTCSYFGVRLAREHTEAFSSGATNYTQIAYASVTTYTPVFGTFEVIFLDSGFNQVVAAESVSSSVLITVGPPAKVQRQGFLIPNTNYSQVHGRNVTTAVVSDFVVSVPFPGILPVLVNISGVSQTIQHAKKFNVVSQATFFCRPGTIVRCADNSLNSSAITGASCVKWKCVQCPDGHISDLPDVEMCRPCPAGTFAIANRSACLPCTKNTWSPAAFQHNSDLTNGTCIPCPMYFFAVVDHRSCIGLTMMTQPPSSIVSKVQGTLPPIAFVNQDGVIVNASANIHFQLHCCNPKTSTCFPEVSCNADKVEQTPPFFSSRSLKAFVPMHNPSPPLVYSFESFSFTDVNGLIAGSGYCWNITFRNVTPPLVADHEWFETFKLFSAFPVTFLGEIPIVHRSTGISGSNISFSGGTRITVYGQWSPNPKVPVDVVPEQCIFVSLSNNLSKGIFSYRSLANATIPPIEDARTCFAPEGILNVGSFL